MAAPENTDYRIRWSPYVAALVGDKSLIKGGAIFGQGPVPQLWAASDQAFILPQEIADLFAGLTDNGAFNKIIGTGFRIGGTRFMMISSELGKVIRGKRGEMAAAAALSKKAIVVATGNGPPSDVSLYAEKMAAELSSLGF